MIDAPDSLPSIDPELLVATWTSTGTLTSCNAAWRSILGPPDDPWLRLSSDDQQMMTEALTKAAAGTLITNQVVQAHTPERDEPLPVLLNFIPVHLSATGGQQAVQAITVSGEVMAEPTSWTVSQTQQHRLEAIGRMTMGIAHNFNNLLSGLLGHLELLRASETTPDEPGFQDSLDTIERVAEDGAALIDKLQQYIRQDSEARFEPVDLAALVEDCIGITQPYWYNEPRRQGITIDVDRQLDEVPAVMGAPAELREVFVNLILNAVQAMPEGGTLRFRTTSSEENVRVEVEDTGTGMSDSVRQQIFEPLFTTKGERGTGMGLAVTYGIIQKHDGSIEVDTEPGEGTQFILTFPAADAGTATETAPSEIETPITPAHVLIVDDEEMVRSVAKKLLTLKGHTVRHAASGSEALRMIEDQHPDIVFTDYGMPEMSGAQLAELLRARLPDVPVVLLTGETDTGDMTRLVDAVLAKPFKLHELEGVIRDLVH